MSAPVMATRETSRLAQDVDAWDDAPSGAPAAQRRRWGWRAVVGLLVLAVVLGSVGSAPWWGPRALARLAYFRVRRVEIDGARFSAPAELLARLRVDTTWSVWADLDALARRVERHPLVASARVERRLPGTLRLVVTEREPVAMAPSRDGFTVLGGDGRVLPIDPSLVGGVDVPVLAAADPAALRMLDVLRRAAPAMYARVNELRRVGRDELRMTVVPDERVDSAAAGAAGAAGAGGRRAPFVLRTSVDVTADRFADLLPVERDLARRRLRVSEIDLRFRDQVIARLP